MRILVDAGDFATSYSDYFDTLVGTNKTIQINLLEGAKLYGKAVRTDGTPITNVFVKATPRGLFENSPDIGHVDEEIELDADGNFVLDRLLPEHYKISIIADGLSSITTNIVLYSDEENRYLFTFSTNKYININGIILYGKTDEPAGGIEVKCDSWSNKKELATNTDAEGKFKFCVPCVEGQFAISKLHEKDWTN